MAAQTKFDIEDAQELSRQLQNLRDVLNQEFSRLINQWHNLESTWRDDQYSDFVHDFWGEFVDKTKTTIKIYEETSEYLDKKIQIAEMVYGLGAISEILTANLPIQKGNANSPSASSQSAPNNPKNTDNSPLDTLINGITNRFYQTIGALRKGTASSMIFVTMLCGGLMKNYDEIIAPAITVYDEMIAKNPNLPEDSAPAVITDISDQAKERHGLSNGNFEQLDTWKGIEKAKKDEEDERQRKLPVQPEITGGK
jgi:hypothetical protein